MHKVLEKYERVKVIILMRRQEVFITGIMPGFLQTPKDPVL